MHLTPTATLTTLTGSKYFYAISSLSSQAVDCHHNVITASADLATYMYIPKLNWTKAIDQARSTDALHCTSYEVSNMMKSGKSTYVHNYMLHSHTQQDVYA